MLTFDDDTAIRGRSLWISKEVKKDDSIDLTGVNNNLHLKTNEISTKADELKVFVNDGTTELKSQTEEMKNSVVQILLNNSDALKSQMDEITLLHKKCNS